MAVFRVEKTKNYTVMSNHHLQNTKLSLKAKGMISLMLSLPDSWDYTTRGLAAICKDGVDSINSTIKELEKYGYLTRKRIRNAKGQLTNIEYTIHEEPKLDFPTLDNPVMELPNEEEPIKAKHVQLNKQQSNKKELSTKELNTNSSSIKSSLDDMKDRIKNYENLIKQNICYDIICQAFAKQRVDEIVELMIEVLCSTKTQIRVSGQEIHAELVKNRFLKLNQFHIEYIFHSMNQNTTEIKNIKSYLLTTLYNAPVTMEHYYESLVRHDLYD